ncbi:transcription factor bHLH96-like [Iris pallida]|uniref:Transcription factor bHLH96-like n=1 Tax=Iris pallida TaxID=29817 RepID=A0AAX6HL02_IRIPA|nr:transcription factor bHLH96-like [Iris pallida]
MNMALEAVVFPQDPFGCATNMELLGFGGWSFLYDGFGGDQEIKADGVGSYGEWHAGLPLPSVAMTQNGGGDEEEERKAATTTTEVAAVAGRKKRRRTKSCKNEEEVENQRRTHIAVERNRRKLMNDYLTVLRSLMPPSYVQRGDQASIVGGAINFVKELEQLLQSLEARRRHKLTPINPSGSSSSSSAGPFSDFFTFPQYSTSAQCRNTTSTAGTNAANETVAKNHSAVADIEVTMVESHANLKVLTKQRPKQLLKMVLVLQGLRLTTLHLNVTTVDQMVLYSFSLKVEEDCHLTSVDDIATAVYHMVGKIQEEAGVI